jgi:hypothetical protein
MPLLKPALILKIYLAFKSAQTSALNLDAAQLLLAEELASAIDMYIKSATIIIPPGQTISGAGGGPAPVVGSTVTPSSPAIIT